MNIDLHHTTSFPQTLNPNPNSKFKPRILCAWGSRKRKQISTFGRNNKLILQSACTIASKLGFLPAPLDLLIREQLGGNGSGSGGSGNGFGSGWGGGGFSDGWRRRKRGGKKLGILGLVLICGLGFWLVVYEEFKIGGLGLLLFGLSVNGSKDWIMRFCCCAFLVGLVLNREDLKSFWNLNVKKKNARKGRRKFRIF